MRMTSFSAASLSEGYAFIKKNYGPDTVILRIESDGKSPGMHFTVSVPESADTPPHDTRAASTEDGRALLSAAGFEGAVLSQFERHLASAASDGAREAVSSFLRAIVKVEDFTKFCKRSGVVLFVGPPGAGKTTTLAKAASTLLAQQVKVALVNLDYARLGGGSQLEHLASVLKTPLINPDRPAAVRSALDDSAGTEVFLCDAPSIHPWKLEEIEAAVRYSDDLRGTAVLVCPAGLESNESAEMLSTVRKFGVDRIIVTKCDITRKLGAMLNSVILERYTVLGMQKSRSLSERVSLAEPDSLLSALNIRILT
jgi:flagellar biosynthesis protein FlhF